MPTVLNIQGIIICCTANKSVSPATFVTGCTHAIVQDGYDYAEYGYKSYSPDKDGLVTPIAEDYHVVDHPYKTDASDVTLSLTLVGNPGWPSRLGDAADLAPFSDPQVAYLTQRQVTSLLDYLTVKCQRYHLDPLGTFQVGEKTYGVISQVSEHDSTLPLNAGFNLEHLRSLVKDRMKPIISVPDTAVKTAVKDNTDVPNILGEEPKS